MDETLREVMPRDLVVGKKYLIIHGPTNQRTTGIFNEAVPVMHDDYGEVVESFQYHFTDRIGELYITSDNILPDNLDIEDLNENPMDPNLFFNECRVFEPQKAAILSKQIARNKRLPPDAEELILQYSRGKTTKKRTRKR